jgi:hypothetical protein
MTEVLDSDRIRQAAFERYIMPTRRTDHPLVIVRAGDVAAELGVQLPAVCAALGTTLFETTFKVRRVYVHGPLQGANTYLVFDVSPAI